MTFILSVSGWRDWDQGETVIHNQLGRYLNQYRSMLHVRVGCARGVDEVIRRRVAQMESAGLGVTWTVYRALWDVHGRGAGPIRNGEMLHGRNPHDPFPDQLAHRLLAFPQPGIDWRMPGSGTVDCILQAVGLGITVEVPGFLRQEPVPLFD